MLSSAKSRSRCDIRRDFGLNSAEAAVAGVSDIGTGFAGVFVGADLSRDRAVKADADNVDEKDLVELVDVDRDV